MKDGFRDGIKDEERVMKDLDCWPGRIALEAAHILNVIAVIGISWLVMNYVFGKHDSAAEVSVLNGALCYFERDASERIARAIVKTIPGISLPVIEPSKLQGTTGNGVSVVSEVADLVNEVTDGLSSVSTPPHEGQ